MKLATNPLKVTKYAKIFRFGYSLIVTMQHKHFTAFKKNKK